MRASLNVLLSILFEALISLKELLGEALEHAVVHNLDQLILPFELVLHTIILNSLVYTTRWNA